MLPQGVFSVAVATVLFPSLARASRRAATLDGFRSTVSLGVRQIAFLLVPCERRHGGARRAADAPDLPAWRVHGEPDAGRRRCLAALTLGLAFNGTMLMLNRAFFSLQSNWVPTAGRARQPAS